MVLMHSAVHGVGVLMKCMTPASTLVIKHFLKNLMHKDCSQFQNFIESIEHAQNSYLQRELFFIKKYFYLCNTKKKPCRRHANFQKSSHFQNKIDYISFGRAIIFHVMCVCEHCRLVCLQLLDHVNDCVSAWRHR
jgi:hypothetical protein